MYIPMALPTSTTSTTFFARFGQCEFLEIDEEELDTTSLQPRIVKSPTREILLSAKPAWPPSSSDASVDAATLLQDLTQLAPSVAKEFIPKDHTLSTFPFRLIHDVGFQGQEDGYIALSYCRKTTTPVTPRRVVTTAGDLPFGWTKEVEQFPLPTSAAVFQAAVRERRIGEGLWFDQVCVNQDDELERTMTSGAIDTIYGNARMAVIALDDIAASPDEEQFLRYYIDQYSYSELPPNQQPNSGLSPPFMQQCAPLQTFFAKLLNSTWFERAWCMHEMRMARGHVFLVPVYREFEDDIQTVIRFTGSFFLHLLVLASELTSTSGQLSNTRSLLDFFHKRVMIEGEGAIYRPDTPQTPSTETTSFVATIADTFKLKAGGHPRLPEYMRRLDANRDKASLALNGSGLPLALAPSNPFSRPNIEDECLRSLLLVGIAAHDPVGLCTTGSPLQLHDGSVSWLSRPTTLDVPANRPPPPRFSKRAKSITQSSDGRAEYAQLDLIFLELPHRLQPNPNFPSHVTRARLYIDLCMQYGITSTGLWSFWQAQDHARSVSLRNIYIQTLACVFDCGSQWLLEMASTVIAPGSPSMDRYAIEMLMNPHLIIQNYILLPEGQTALTQLLDVLSGLISSGIPWASGSSERTHGPLIITAPSSEPSSAASSSSTMSPYSGLRSPPLSLPSPTTNKPNKAIIFAPFEHSKTLLIAVPDAVKPAAYDSLARGWILTSMNPFTGSPKPTVSWTLQCKGVIFGDSRFNQQLAGSGLKEVRNHRVYGPSKQ